MNCYYNRTVNGFYLQLTCYAAFNCFYQCTPSTPTEFSLCSSSGISSYHTPSLLRVPLSSPCLKDEMNTLSRAQQVPLWPCLDPPAKPFSWLLPPLSLLFIRDMCLGNFLVIPCLVMFAWLCLGWVLCLEFLSSFLTSINFPFSFQAFFLKSKLFFF